MKKYFLINKKAIEEKQRRLLRGGALFYFFFVSLLFLGAQKPPLYQVGTSFTTTYLDLYNNLKSINEKAFFQGKVDTNKCYPSYIYLVSNTEQCVTVKVPHLNFEQAYHVKPDSLTNVTLPYSAEYFYETPVNRAILVNSPAPVNVIYGQNTDTITRLSINIKRLDTSKSYFEKLLPISAMAINPNQRMKDVGKVHPYGVRSPVLVQAQERGEQVPDLFRLSAFSILNLGQRNSLKAFLVPYSYYLNLDTILTGPNTRGQLGSGRFAKLDGKQGYYIAVSTFTPVALKHDTSSFYSNNNLPFKIYQVSESLDIHLTGRITSGIINEELALPYAMDTAFHFGELAGYEGYVASLQATEDSTRVVVNGQKVIYLDKLEGLDTAVSGPLSIRASAPLVGYLANDATDTTGYPRYNNNFTSFFSVAANGDNHLMTESLFATLGKTDGNYHYQLALICRTADTAQLTLDGSPLPPGSFTIFPGDSLWSYANVEVSRGVHRVACAGGFHGFHYNYYWDTQRPKGLVFSNYGYNLAQNVTWPQDSFYYRVGSTPQSMQPFQNFEQPVLCPGDSLYFYPSQRHHKTWLWDMGDGTLITQKNGDNAPAPLPYAWPEGGTYTVVLRDSVGCAPTDSLQITVQSGQVAGFTAEVQPRCEGFQINLVAQSSGPHQWRYPGGSSSDSSHRFHYTGALQELPITLITGEGNCADTLQKTATLPEGEVAEPTLPNVFTPNGDGVNDAFCIPDAAPFAGCFSLQVYNRYGRELFASSDPTQCWQPERNIAQGVYFYVLRIGDQDYRKALHLQR